MHMGMQRGSMVVGCAGSLCPMGFCGVYSKWHCFPKF